MMRIGSLLSALTCSLAVLAAPLHAKAQTSPETGPSDWELCNETSFILQAAVATGASIQDALSRGWYRLLPGECRVEAVSPSDTRFIYAESSQAHQGGIREWSGNVELCATDKNFQSKLNMTCELQDLETRQFLTVDADETRTAFVEPAGYGRKAQAAGLQRLLRDIGEKVTRIDGLVGRRTRDQLKAFRADNELSASASETETLIALEKAALALQDEIGLTLCNKSSRPVWVAIAHNVGKSIESKGWWSLPIQSCVRPLTENLQNKGVHFYAVQEAPPAEPTDNNEVLLKALEDRPIRTTGEATFCISEARFSALGNTECADNGYLSAKFRAVLTEEMGVKIDLLDTDFSVSDLR